METLNNNTTESEKEKFDKDILKDPELLRHLYHVKLLSFSKIANKIGCNPATVFKAFKKYGIQTRSYSQSSRLFMEIRQPFDRSILDDAKKLRHLYQIEKKSAPEIAEMIGCCISTVYKYLKKHEIAIRSRKESNRLTKEKRFPFDRSILNDAERLRQIYHGETKLAKEIAILIGCDEDTVYYYMKKHGIKRRSQIEVAKLRFKKSISVSPLLAEFLKGSLLGDGHIKERRIVSHYQLCIKHLEYIKHVQTIFRESGYKTGWYEYYNPKLDCTHYTLYVNSTVELHCYRKMWYPNGIKCVPEDIELTPISCLYWYLEDGSPDLTNQRIKGIVFSTPGFSRLENRNLVNKLKRVLNIKDGFSINKRNYIRLNKKPALRFLNYIGGKSPVQCFTYKFDRSELRI